MVQFYMSPFVAQLLPFFLFLCMAALAVGVVSYWNWSNKRSKKKNPLTTDLLRAPGEALREKLEDMRLDLFGHMLLLIVMPMMMFAMWLSQTVFWKKPSTFLSVLEVVLVAGFIAWLIRKMFRLRKELQNNSLGLDAEVAVGQELNHLMRNGFWVYHDFPADEFNIDHIVIGPTGVFAVETKGRPKTIGDAGKANPEVFYDGETLTFPTWKEHKPIEQAERQAKWLEKWLSSAVGEQVVVHPVIAIPGWYITRQKQGGVPVINGKNPSGFFTKYGNENLSDKQQQQIVHHVDQRCRTVTPRAYKYQQ